MAHTARELLRIAIEKLVVLVEIVILLVLILRREEERRLHRHRLVVLFLRCTDRGCKHRDSLGLGRRLQSG